MYIHTKCKQTHRRDKKSSLNWLLDDDKLMGVHERNKQVLVLIQ